MYWALLGKRALLQRTVKHADDRPLLELERTVKQRARFTETLVGVY